MTRSLTVEWGSSPDVVGAAMQRAIDEERYEDAEHPEWPLWLVRGSVKGRTVDLRLDTHSAPGSRHFYPAGFDVRGELVPHGSGTRLVARAAMLDGKWEKPIAIVVSAGVGLPALLLGGVIGVLLCVAAVAFVSLGFWAIMSLVGRGYFTALPQVEAVLREVGSPSG